MPLILWCSYIGKIAQSSTKKIVVILFCLLFHSTSHAKLDSSDFKISAYAGKKNQNFSDINTIINSDSFISLDEYYQLPNKSGLIKITWDKSKVRDERFIVNNEVSIYVSGNYFLIKDNQVIESYSSGIDEPSSNKPIEHFKFAFDVGQADYILADFCCNTKLSTYFLLLSEDELAEDYYNRVTKYTVIFALITAFIFYNFLIWLYLREKKYFWYCCHLGLAMFVLLSTSGIGKQFLWTDAKDMAFFYYNQGIMFSIAGMMFLTSFLNKKSISKRSFQLIFAMVSLQITAAIIFLVIYVGFNDVFFEFLNKYLLVVHNLTRFGLLLNTYILIRAVMAGDKTAKFLLIGYGIVNLGVAVLLLRRYYIIPDNSWTQFGMEVAIVIEAIFLSLVLAQNMQFLRQEKLDIEKEQQQQQQQFSWQLIEVQEEEKRHISSTLHDNFTHQLLVLKNNLIKKIGAGSEISDVEKILEEIRSLSHLIHPYILEKLGLEAALVEISLQLTQNDDFDINLSYCNCMLSKAQELMVFRIIQEALNNIIKHAKAHECIVALEYKKGEATLKIKDDGDGFNVDNNDGFGLKMIKERCSKLCGNFSLQSDNDGTTITITFPVNVAIAHNQRHTNNYVQ